MVASASGRRRQEERERVRLLLDPVGHLLVCWHPLLSTSRLLLLLFYYFILDFSLFICIFHFFFSFVLRFFFCFFPLLGIVRLPAFRDLAQFCRRFFHVSGKNCMQCGVMESWNWWILILFILVLLFFGASSSFTICLGKYSEVCAPRVYVAVPCPTKSTITLIYRQLGSTKKCRFHWAMISRLLANLS